MTHRTSITRPNPSAAPIARARALRIGFGLLLGGFAFWLAIRDVRVVELRAVLARAHLLWVLAALASVVLTVAVGVARWRVLFPADEERPSWPNLAAALLIGQMLNIMLPLRLGEMARAYWLSRAEPMPIGRALGTIGIEKLADLTSLGAAAGALLLLVSVPSWADAPGRALIVTAIGAACAIVLVATSGRSIVGAVTGMATYLPPAVGARLKHLGETALEGSRVLESWRASAAVAFLSLVGLTLAASTNYILFSAFELGLPAAAALVLLFALQVGNTLVSVPGNLGVFHYVTILTLGAYSVDRDVALGYAIVLYLVALVPKILAGGLFLAFATRDMRLPVWAWGGRT